MPQAIREFALGVPARVRSRSSRSAPASAEIDLAAMDVAPAAVVPPSHRVGVPLRRGRTFPTIPAGFCRFRGNAAPADVRRLSRFVRSCGTTFTGSQVLNRLVEHRRPQNRLEDADGARDFHWGDFLAGPDVRVCLVLRDAHFVELVYVDTIDDESHESRWSRQLRRSAFCQSRCGCPQLPQRI